MPVHQARNKYGARAVILDGIRFASKREATRYGHLRLLERAGEIRGLELQPRWVFMVNGIQVASYKADFRYEDVHTGAVIVEDAKSPATKKARDYPIRVKLLRALFGVTVREV